MKKLIMFLMGVLLLAVSCATLYFSGAIYDAGDARHIESFVMQPNNLSAARIGRPVMMENILPENLGERLIRKFVYEYFYINPDIENIAARTTRNSVMAAMSAPTVFADWKRGEADAIEKLATKKVMRTVNIAREILKKGDYFEVHYDLKTWTQPNDMELIPTVTSGVMYLKITLWDPNDPSRIRDMRAGQKFDVQKYLAEGGDPAAIFKFRVEEVRR